MIVQGVCYLSVLAVSWVYVEMCCFFDSACVLLCCVCCVSQCVVLCEFSVLCAMCCL